MKPDPDIVLADWRDKALEMENEVNKVVKGNSRAIRLIITSIFARGHVILKGEVGVAKTTILRSVARCLGGGFSRVPGTEDLMPSDLIVRMDYDRKAEKWIPEPGPLLVHGDNLAVLFFNEINRARPQALSAILQAMEERTVEAFGRTWDIPYLNVFADRNSLETGQTHEIISAGFDRFFREITIVVPEDAEVRKEIFCNPRYYNMNKLVDEVREGIVEFREINDVFEAIQQGVEMSSEIQTYVDELWQATRNPKKFRIDSLKDADVDDTASIIQQGASSRGGGMLARSARTNAWINGCVDVLPEHVLDGFDETMAHRVFLTHSAERRRSAIARHLMVAIKEKVSAP